MKPAKLVSTFSMYRSVTRPRLEAAARARPVTQLLPEADGILRRPEVEALNAHVARIAFDVAHQAPADAAPCEHRLHEHRRKTGAPRPVIAQHPAGAADEFAAKPSGEVPLSEDLVGVIGGIDEAEKGVGLIRVDRRPD